MMTRKNNRQELATFSFLVLFFMTGIVTRSLSVASSVSTLSPGHLTFTRSHVSQLTVQPLYTTETALWLGLAFSPPHSRPLPRQWCCRMTSVDNQSLPASGTHPRTLTGEKRGCLISRPLQALFHYTTPGFGPYAEFMFSLFHSRLFV